MTANFIFGCIKYCPITMQTTYCENMLQHAETLGRKMKVINLDPAVIDLPYPVSIGMVITFFRRWLFRSHLTFVFSYLLCKLLASIGQISGT